jgi:hypothetical protein
MKEIVRSQYDWQPLTNLLDPDSKPYLVLTENGEYHILYWKAWFAVDSDWELGRFDLQWSGSDWYDSPPTQRNAQRSRYWPKRIWELNGVDYQPRNIVECKSPLDRLLQDNKVKKYKSLANGLVAIRKGGMWHYYRFQNSNKRYVKTGSTQRLER